MEITVAESTAAPAAPVDDFQLRGHYIASSDDVQSEVPPLLLLGIGKPREPRPREAGELLGVWRLLAQGPAWAGEVQGPRGTPEGACAECASFPRWV
jgi:hypothetical protein